MKKARHESPHIVGFLLYQLSGLDNSVDAEGRAVTAEGWGGGGDGEPPPMGTDFLFGVMEIA